MTVIGVTGGMGGGKTTVCRALEALGYAVYYADVRAKRLMNEDPALRRAITSAFGPQIYPADGALDRARLAQIVFADRNALQTLNALVHPAVKLDFERWLAQRPTQRSWVVKEAAIMFEAGTNVGCKAVVYVSAPEAVRILRIAQRESLSEAEIRRRLDNQWPDERKIPLADYLIVNDGKNPILPQIYAMIRWIEHEIA
ncbi:MAG: dephospho-CoA kinase [Bacteroidia bacterium]|nr:dephospho-CoA kinase [Bacteroidia bacterium]MDW8333561.1 dephospho-CoA kinase [Bacteroidia bacterium]